MKNSGGWKLHDILEQNQQQDHHTWELEGFELNPYQRPGSPFLLPYRSLVNRVLIFISTLPFIYRNLMFVIILSWKCHLNLSLMSWGVAQNSTMWTSHCRPSWGWPQVLLHHQSVSQWHWTFCLFDCFYFKNHL